MQIDIIAAVLGKTVDAVTAAKFMKPVRPGERLHYVCTETPKGSRIVAKDGAGDVVCDARVKWHGI